MSAWRGSLRRGRWGLIVLAVFLAALFLALTGVAAGPRADVPASLLAQTGAAQEMMAIAPAETVLAGQQVSPIASFLASITITTEQATALALTLVVLMALAVTKLFLGRSQYDLGCGCLLEQLGSVTRAPLPNGVWMAVQSRRSLAGWDRRRGLAAPA